MKKFLVLALVLGIASLATAGLDLATINGLSYEVVGNTVNVIGTGVTGYLFNLESDNGSALSNALVPASFATRDNGADMGGGAWAGASAANTSAVAAGTIFSIDFTPGTQKLFFVYSSAVGDNSAISVGGASVQLSTADGSLYEMTVPEPATMALLGLGGLFLARRKK